ncbi:MAG TPA: hypothetical protein VGH19_15305 [Verrucomicrobiae bacterium]
MKPYFWLLLNQHRFMMSIKTSTAKTFSLISLGLGLTLILLAGCQTPKSASQNAILEQENEAHRIDTARLYALMGIKARSYSFELKPDEVLAVRFHGQKMAWT